MKNTRGLWKDTSSTTGSKPVESRQLPSSIHSEPTETSGRAGYNSGYELLRGLRPLLARRRLGTGLPRVELGHYHHQFLRLVQLANHVLQLASVVVFLLGIVLVVHVA